MTGCCALNYKRVIFGGFLAGLWVFLGEWVAHGVILMERYTHLAQMGLLFSSPRFPFPGVLFLLSAGVGLVLACFYALARGTLRPGPLTAVFVGCLVWYAMALPANVADLAWSPIGKLVPFVTTSALWVECVGGALIAGSVYKPVPPAGG